ncbi:hypothetical protein AB0M32_09610 [Streptomyces sp. NPDC051985]|uniref:hypothetical protein n=1 Tax=Streptomyces sp. NPDC051985 TaxID=3155807 RepID=UPI0034291FE6
MLFTTVVLIRPSPQVGRNKWWAARTAAGAQPVVAGPVLTVRSGGGFLAGTGNTGGASNPHTGQKET